MNQSLCTVNFTFSCSDEPNPCALSTFRCFRSNLCENQLILNKFKTAQMCHRASSSGYFWRHVELRGRENLNLFQLSLNNSILYLYWSRGISFTRTTRAVYKYSHQVLYSSNISTHSRHQWQRQFMHVHVIKMVSFCILSYITAFYKGMPKPIHFPI